MARVFGDLERQYLDDVLQSGWLGTRHDEASMTARLEKAFAQKVGAGYGIARSSAMMALAQAISVSGAGPGYEVICDPIVHFGGVAALYFNAVPRFADVRYDTYLMDPASVRANVTDRTKALIVTNLWGLCAQLDELRAICDEHGIFMIEDCAHNLGSYWKGRHAGTFGGIGCFSFQQGKHLPTGDGGMMVTDKEDFYINFHQMWAFGGEVRPFMTLNYRMNEMTAAVGLAQLPRVDDYIREYTESLNTLNEAIADCKWLRNRHVPEEAIQSGYIWACTWEGDRYGLEYDRFKEVCDGLGIVLRFGFIGRPAYTFDCFRQAYRHTHCPVQCPFYESDYRYHDGLCPVAEDLMPRLITRGLVEAPPTEIKRLAELLRTAIKNTEQG